MRNLLLATVAVSLFGCSAGADIHERGDALGESSASIIGGTETSSDPGVVAILAKRPGQEGSALCTGTVIAPTVILTAAHCVDPAVLGGDDATFVVVAGDANLTDGVPDDAKLAVKSVHWDPEFSHTNLPNGHDIGVVILEQPTTIAPVKWNTKPLPESLKGGEVRIIGYGLDDGWNQTGAGIKRVASTKLSSFDDKLVTHGTWTTKICQGDSGGPVFATIDGEEQVIGVNSYGFIYCLGNGNSTRTDVYASFVQSFLQ